jgi:hypothetical protein
MRIEKTAWGESPSLCSLTLACTPHARTHQTHLFFCFLLVFIFIFHLRLCSFLLAGLWACLGLGRCLGTRLTWWHVGMPLEAVKKNQLTDSSFSHQQESCKKYYYAVVQSLGRKFEICPKSVTHTRTRLAFRVSKRCISACVRGAFKVADTIRRFLRLGIKA